MRWVIVGFLLLCAYSVSYAVNGFDWRKFDDMHKACFLQGYIEHINESCYDIEENTVLRPVDSYSMQHHPDMIYTHMLKGYEYGEIINLINKFYNIPENRNIYFSEAFRLTVIGIKLDNNIYIEQLQKARDFYSKQ